MDRQLENEKIERQTNRQMDRQFENEKTERDGQTDRQMDRHVEMEQEDRHKLLDWKMDRQLKERWTDGRIQIHKRQVGKQTEQTDKIHIDT